LLTGHASFDEAVIGLTKNISTRLKQLPIYLKESAQEIRLIEGYMPQIMINNKLQDIDGDLITGQQLKDSLITLCEGSVHTHQKELSAGFLSLKGGHRASFASTAVYDATGNIAAFRDITAIVIRIAHSFRGISLPLIKKVFDNGLCGVVIAGAPSSGKTTMLKDLAYQLSNGALSDCERVAVIDERCELADCGKSLVLKSYQKAQGMIMALRQLSPQVIICDEIGELNEVKAVKQALNSGIYVITTVHASSSEQLLQRNVSYELISSGAFKRAVILSDDPTVCSIKEVIDIEHVFEADRNSYDNDRLYRSRYIEGKQLQYKIKFT